MSRTRSLGRLVLGGAVVLATGAVPALAQTGGLGVDTTAFDRAVRPQDDFFKFVNGGWLARQQIPADASSWGSFNELREQSRTNLRAIIEEAMRAGGAAGTDRRKIGDLYASFMDTARVERLGTTPLRAEMQVIAGVTSPAALPAAFARMARLGGGSGPFGVGIGPDQKSSRANIVSVSQGGLGLPDRDYYLRQDAKTNEIRAGYQAYLTRLFTLASQPDPAGAATRVVALEAALAQPQWDRARNRDRNATYNRMTVAELAAMTPAWDWRTYLREAGMGAATEVVVRQPDYLRAVNAVIAATPAATWREYMTARLLDGYADVLPRGFQEARFAFRGRMLSGQQEQPVRWKRGVDLVERTLGEAVGKAYVERHFRPEAKTRMDAMVRNLRAAYMVGIDSLEWMSPATRAEAKDKLSKFTVKIGYPDRWRDYSKLEVRRGDLVGNVKRASAWSYADMLDRLGKPVDRNRWGMTPQTVNAYYNATNNEIVFPAAILQPPFFDVNADDAVNYGAIGAVIGHEISHGFDDQGRKSDGEGNLRDWWTAADASAFDQRAGRLGAQYGAIQVIDDIRINPALTMGENIGDLSGLAGAYRAYRMSLGGREAPVIGGFTGDQRFFMGFAQIWRNSYRDAALRQQLLTDPHSPGPYRAFVPLANNDAFHAAWGTKPGDRMWREPGERVKIW